MQSWTGYSSICLGDVFWIDCRQAAASVCLCVPQPDAEPVWTLVGHQYCGAYRPSVMSGLWSLYLAVMMYLPHSDCDFGHVACPTYQIEMHKPQCAIRVEHHVHNKPPIMSVRLHDPRINPIVVAWPVAGVIKVLSAATP